MTQEIWKRNMEQSIGWIFFIPRGNNQTDGTGKTSSKHKTRRILNISGGTKNLLQHGIDINKHKYQTLQHRYIVNGSIR